VTASFGDPLSGTLNAKACLLFVAVHLCLRVVRPGAGALCEARGVRDWLLEGVSTHLSIAEGTSSDERDRSVEGGALQDPRRVISMRGCTRRTRVERRTACGSGEAV
jgi:hypothetical protein